MESQNVATWQKLMMLPDLQEQAAATDARDVAQVQRLRTQHDLPVVSAALDLAAGRRKLAAKGWLRAPGHDGVPIADSQGAEQATHRVVASHKAAWFVDASRSDGAKVFDLCCGVGADAMALAEAGLDLTVIDRDPLRAWMAGTNAGCASVVGDVSDAPVNEALIHIDPSRRIEARGRGETKRSWKLEDYQPDPPTIARLLHRAAGAAVALGPGIDMADLEQLAGSDLPAALQLFSLDGRLVQAVLWTGALVPQAYRVDPPEVMLIATRVSSNALDPAAGGVALRQHVAEHALHLYRPITPSDPLSVQGPWTRSADPQEYIYTIDPAIERLGLMSTLAEELNLSAAAIPDLGVLTSNQPVHSEWLTPFRLHAVMPWRAKKVKRWLSDHDGGLVEVKTRGGAVDPDLAQKQLRGSSTQPYVVFVLRVGDAVQAWIATRETTSGASQG